MPRGDKTGPEGMGSMTGRKMGICAGNEQAGFLNNATTGRGFARIFRSGNGRGGRRLFGRQRNFFNENPVKSTQTDKEMIKNQITYLENKLKDLE